MSGVGLSLRKEYSFRSVATPVATKGRPHGRADATGSTKPVVRSVVSPDTTNRHRRAVRTGVRTLRVGGTDGKGEWDGGWMPIQDLAEIAVGAT